MGFSFNLAGGGEAIGSRDFPSMPVKIRTPYKRF